MKLSNFKVLVFDVYGTLIDWESGIVNALKPLTGQISQSLSRDDILEAHAYHESTTQRWTPSKKYADLLGVVYRRLAEQWGVTVTWDECQVYGASVSTWPAFDDSATSLQYLKNHYKLIVLTNTDNQSFQGTTAQLGIDFDGVYTAEDIGSYKPADRNFEYMLDALKRQGIEQSDILHTAESMFHDHAPANKHGLSNCWIYRRHDKHGFGATMPPNDSGNNFGNNSGDMPHYDVVFKSMAEFVDAHQQEIKT